MGREWFQVAEWDCAPSPKVLVPLQLVEVVRKLCDSTVSMKRILIGMGCCFFLITIGRNGCYGSLRLRERNRRVVGLLGNNRLLSRRIRDLTRVRVLLWL